MIKKWSIRGQTKEEDLYFADKKKAIEAAKKILLNGMKRIVHISKFSEEWSKVNSTRNSYKDVEYWELVNGVPKRTDNMKY